MGPRVPQAEDNGSCHKTEGLAQKLTKSKQAAYEVTGLTLDCTVLQQLNESSFIVIAALHFEVEIELNRMDYIALISLSLQV